VVIGSFELNRKTLMAHADVGRNTVQTCTFNDIKRKLSKTPSK